MTVRGDYLAELDSRATALPDTNDDCDMAAINLANAVEQEADRIGADALVLAMYVLNTLEGRGLTGGMTDTDTHCRHCGRRIIYEVAGRVGVRSDVEPGSWIDPEATGDDSVWRETCDAHDTFTAEHEPERG